MAAPSSTTTDNRLSPTPAPELTLLRDLVRRLESAGIRYCHWKSNFHLNLALAGIDDFDVLIERRRFEEFVGALCALGFRQAETVTSRQQPGVFHFLGSDAETGRLVNVHAYARVLTGDHFLKSWTWPIEELLLGGTREVDGVSIPEASRELVVFTLRGLIKRTGWVDRLLLARHGDESREELDWLLGTADVEESARLCAEHLPELGGEDLKRAVHSFGRPDGERDLRRIAKGAARRLGKYRRFSAPERTWRTGTAILRMVWNKLGGRKHMRLSAGGRIIAFVGPQACGKSTLISRVAEWLGVEISVHRFHVGKPPASALTWLPTRAIPLARRLLPGRRTMTVEQSLNEDAEEKPRSFPLLYVVRKVMLAWDRRKVCRAAYRKSRAGEVVLCDRYPSDVPGAVDGRSFTDEEIENQASGLRRRLMELERHLYAEIPSPDLVVELTVSVEVALQRNLARNKDVPQTQDYVRFRHQMLRQPEFRRTEVLRFDTSGDLEELVREMKRGLWERM